MTAAVTRPVRWVTREILDWPATMKGFVILLGCLSALLAVAEGGHFALLASGLAAVIVVLVISFFAEPGDRHFLLIVGIAALFGRQILTFVFDLLLVARTGGHVFAPDEGLYLRLAGRLVDKWHDPSVYIDPEDGLYQSEYVLTIARIFYSIGPNVAVIKVINTTFSVLTSLVVYRTMANLQLPGRRWALALTLLFPSIVLWSSLALKDAYVSFFIVAVVWTSSEYIRSRNQWWHLATLAALLPIESVRRYIFVTMGIAWLFVILAVHGRERIRAAAVIVSTLVLILVIFRPLRDLGVNVFYVPIAIREAGAIGGRTSFVDPPPVVRGEPGDCVIIQSTNATAALGSTPREFFTQPGAQVFFEGRSTPPPGNAPRVVVRPGDLVCFPLPAPPPSGTGAAGGQPPVTPTPTPVAVARTPSPTRPPTTVVLNPDAKNIVGERVQVDSDSGSVTGSLLANARHLPVGLFYLFGAPFPWAAQTLLDLATIPEALLWYACLALAFVGFIGLVRERDFRFAHGVAAAAGMALVFAVIGSNVGTLLRQRGMMVPFFIVLTAVGIELCLDRWPALGHSSLFRLMRGHRLHR